MSHSSLAKRPWQAERRAQQGAKRWRRRKGICGATVQGWPVESLSRNLLTHQAGTAKGLTNWHHMSIFWIATDCRQARCKWNPFRGEPSYFNACRGYRIKEGKVFLIALDMSTLQVISWKSETVQEVHWASQFNSSNRIHCPLHVEVQPHDKGHSNSLRIDLGHSGQRKAGLLWRLVKAGRPKHSCTSCRLCHCTLLSS